MSESIVKTFRPAKTVEEMARRLFFTVSKLANEWGEHPTTVLDIEAATRSGFHIKFLPAAQRLLKESGKVAISQGRRSGTYRFLHPQGAGQ